MANSAGGTSRVGTRFGGVLRFEARLCDSATPGLANDDLVGAGTEDSRSRLLCGWITYIIYMRGEPGRTVFCQRFKQTRADRIGVKHLSLSDLLTIG